MANKQVFSSDTAKFQHPTVLNASDSQSFFQHLTAMVDGTAKLSLGSLVHSGFSVCIRTIPITVHSPPQTKEFLY